MRTVTTSSASSRRLPVSSEVRCAFCYRTPEEIDYTMFKESWQSHDEYVIAEEGTYDPESEQFLCDACYIKLGQPSGPYGWTCTPENYHKVLKAKLADILSGKISTQ